jgi:hypothetical protein
MKRNSFVNAVFTASLLASGLSGAVEVENLTGEKSEVLEFAVSDLSRYLGKVSGQIRLSFDPALGDQQWRFRSASDGSLDISGKDGRGVVYGIYTFLERHAGVRWYAPDTERAAVITALPQLDVYGRPAMRIREMYTAEDDGTFSNGVWRLRNKETRRPAFGTAERTGRPKENHSMDVYVRAVTNKSLFGVTQSGKKCTMLCMSNPDVARIVAEEMMRNIERDRAERKGQPEYEIPKVYELSQPDGGGGGECHCRGCHAAYLSAGKRYSGPNIRFANAVAPIVGKKYPDVRIRTFAYSYTELPPKDIRAADNVEVRYCRSFLYQPLTAATDNGRTLSAWRKHASHFHVWGYWRTYSGPLFPMVKPRADIGDEMRFCRDSGVCGYFAEAESPLLRSFARLQKWLMLKLSENPDLDVMELSKEFMWAYYGAAASPMTELLECLENRLIEQRNRIDPEFLRNTNSGYLAMYTLAEKFGPGFFEKANAILDRAEKLVADDSRARRHVRRERTVIDRAFFAEVDESFDRNQCMEIAGRYRRNAEEVVKAWDFGEQERARRLKSIAEEAAVFSRMPLPVPKELKGREISAVYCVNDIHNSRRALVADADSPTGFAVYNKKDDIVKFPFTMGFYVGWPGHVESQQIKITREEIPQDGKYHLYRLGAGRSDLDARVYFDWTWAFKVWLPCYGMPSQEREFWVSAKFTGPAFVRGSKDPNRLLVERIFVVAPESVKVGEVRPAKARKKAAELPESVVCGGAWRAHCQGVATDSRHIYWSFTVALVKTDLKGNVVAKMEIPNGHMGDLCHKDGKLYVGVNNGRTAEGTRVGDEVWVFDAATLSREAVHPTPQTIWCNNGIEWYGGSFWVIGNVSPDSAYNYVWEYTPDFRFKCCHPMASGWTNLGVQTICFAGGEMLFGCYGGVNGKGEGVPECVFAVDPAALTAPYRSNERPPIVPVIRRDNVNAGEGLLELNGYVWYVHGRTKGKTPDGLRLWTARLIPWRKVVKKL